MPDPGASPQSRQGLQERQHRATIPDAMHQNNGPSAHPTPDQLVPAFPCSTCPGTAPSASTRATSRRTTHPDPQSQGHVPFEDTPSIDSLPSSGSHAEPHQAHHHKHRHVRPPPLRPTAITETTELGIAPLPSPACPLLDALVIEQRSKASLDSTTNQHTRHDLQMIQGQFTGVSRSSSARPPSPTRPSAIPPPVLKMPGET